MGTATDRSIREELQRVDSHLHHDLVKEARRLMYEEGYAVNGDKVNDVLKHVSGVPTTVSLLNYNQRFTTCCVDKQLEHVFEAARCVRIGRVPHASTGHPSRV